MTAEEQQHYQRLTALAQEYAWVRLVLVGAHKTALEEVASIASAIERADREALVVLEAARDLEGDD